MNVEDKRDREGGDVTHPRGPRFARETQERVEGSEVRNEVGL